MQDFMVPHGTQLHVTLVQRLVLRQTWFVRTPTPPPNNDIKAFLYSINKLAFSRYQKAMVWA